MKISKKICVSCNIPSYIFSKKMCKNCWAKNYKKSIKKISSKGIKKKEDKKELLRQDFRFYFNIWKKRPHKCVNCDCYLGETPLTYFFDHILEKSKYPELRHNEDNIQLLCLICHNNKTTGNYSDKITKTIIETKEKLNKK